MELTEFQVLKPLLGGALIGLSANLMLLLNGRVTGISGILDAALSRHVLHQAWRPLFLVGLFYGGFIAYRIEPSQFVNSTNPDWIRLAAAGLLVGFGSVMGSGCTSGHGVCGMSRFSVRSIVATTVFMFTGAVAVQLVRWLADGNP